MAFSVQSSDDQNSSSKSTPAIIIFIVVGVTVCVVATALLGFVVYQRLRSRNNFLNEPQYI